MAGLLLALVGGAFGTLALAAGSADGIAPEGTTVGGVDVGGLDRAEAVALLQREVGRAALRPVKVAVAGETYRLTARSGAYSVDHEAAVDRAIAAAGTGSFVTRGFDALTGRGRGGAQPVTVSVDRAAVATFVDRVAETVAVPAQDAALRIGLTGVGVTEGEPGRELAARDRVVRRLVRVIAERRAKRTVAARTRAVAPAVTREALQDDLPSFVTVDKAGKTVRVFADGELDKTYDVAIGADGYDTPEGSFTVQTMQVDPPWNVPQSDWAGELAGQTIAAGDPDNPLVARWIGFDGAVGFHGTQDRDSIGTAASRGCVRMRPRDVIDLYDRVQVGSTVFVA